jgi:3-oxoacyl-[acyl-carrier-protein] synthase-1
MCNSLERKIPKVSAPKPYMEWSAQNANQMIVLGDAIISPLGFSSDENYSSVKRGLTGLRLHQNVFQVLQDFCGALLDRELVRDTFQALCPSVGKKFTFFEQIAILSAQKAIAEAEIHPDNADVVFILSTTKGNVELLEHQGGFDSQRIHLWKSAQIISSFFGNKNFPVVVSNACTSGLTAQQVAAFYLNHRPYQYAVVIGAEVLSKFIIAGFQSFKALSMQVCRPFDRNRDGLNLGEAAACIVYAVKNKENMKKAKAIYLSGAGCNDANHISAPSRTGDGLFNVLRIALKNVDCNNISFISAHGTATPYNDAMEAAALTRAGLNHLPVNSLKSYFGHTLGAAGILETIISYHALQECLILKNPTFRQTDENVNIKPNKTILNSDKPLFIKLMSGFGGNNAVMVMAKSFCNFSKHAHANNGNC